MLSVGYEVVIGNNDTCYHKLIDLKGLKQTYHNRNVNSPLYLCLAGGRKHIF